MTTVTIQPNKWFTITDLEDTKYILERCSNGNTDYLVSANLNDISKEIMEIIKTIFDEYVITYNWSGLFGISNGGCIYFNPYEIDVPRYEFRVHNLKYIVDEDNEDSEFLSNLNFDIASFIEKKKLKKF